MVDRWERFNKKYDEEFESLKKLMNITLYGPYFPETEKDFLIEMIDYLQGRGFVNTNLVEDYDDVTYSDPLEKSLRCLEFSHVNFLIFTRAGENQGVGRELHHCATSELMIDRIPFCVVFDQIKDKVNSVSVLSLEDMENAGIGRREFETEAQLRDRLYRFAAAKLRMLKSRLIKDM